MIQLSINFKCILVMEMLRVSPESRYQEMISVEDDDTYWVMSISSL